MIGDKIIAKPHHKRAARMIFDLISESFAQRRSALTIAGESGSGKSEIAHELAELFNTADLNTYVFQQDDYFHYPPKTNHDMRLKNIRNIGMKEVNLALLNRHLEHFKSSPNKPLEKPLVIFEEDKLSRERINPGDYSLAIAEGTYTTCLTGADCHVFIDRTFRDTMQARLERAREKIDEFSEKIMQIEHDIISKHKKMATVIVDKDYNARTADRT